MKKLGAACVVGLLSVVAMPAKASAATIGFTCLTNNGPGDGGLACGTYAPTFTGTVTATATGFTATINNGGLGAGVITLVAVNAPGTGTGYTLASLIENPPNVDFSIDGTGLPGSGANLGAGFTSEFSAGAASPPTTKGVNAAESIGLVFTMTAPLNQAGLDALLANGTLQFGIHVQSLPAGQSEKLQSSFTPLTTVPEPASMLLLGTGLLAAARARRRKVN